MGQIQFTISLVLIGLFTIAVLGFAINFANDNNSEIDLSDDPELSNLKKQGENNLSSFKEGSQSTYQSIVESSIEEGETTPSGGQFAITPTSVVGTTRNILKTGYLKIFGTGNGFGVFITAFLSLIGFVFGLYLWKTWAGRIPD